MHTTLLSFSSCTDQLFFCREIRINTSGLIIQLSPHNHALLSFFFLSTSSKVWVILRTTGTSQSGIIQADHRKLPLCLRCAWTWQLFLLPAGNIQQHATSCLSVQTMPRCDTHARTFTHDPHRHKRGQATPPLFSFPPYPLLLWNLSPRQRGMWLWWRRQMRRMKKRGHGVHSLYINEGRFDGGHEGDNRDRANNICPKWRYHRASLSFPLCNVGGRSVA